MIYNEYDMKLSYEIEIILVYCPLFICKGAEVILRYCVIDFLKKIHQWNATITIMNLNKVSIQIDL